MAKYGELIKQARKPENQNSGQIDDQVQDNQERASGKAENQIASKPDEDLVNLCVKVPRLLRQHWAAEAKRQGITMTEVITSALLREFGEP